MAPTAHSINYGLRNLGLYLFTIIIGFAATYSVGQLLPTFLANIFFGKASPNFPFSFQMFMWIPFFIGIHELLIRYLDYVETRSYLDDHLLSENRDKIYTSKDLAKILRLVDPVADSSNGVLPKLIQQIIYKFQSNKSIEEGTNTLTQFVEIFEKSLDLFYARLRYLTWFIPTLGFIGTVYGISITVSEVGLSSPEDPQLLQRVAASLAVAFDTTLLALVQSAILLYIMSVIESAEEKNLLNMYKYTFENLINRLDPYEQKT
jgi:hypothetical protein